MSYKLKNRDEFQDFLNTVVVLPSYDEICIDKFKSSSLFDLYELLVTIKNDRQISLAMQEKLKKHLETNFSKDISLLLNFPVTGQTLHDFEEYMKDIFLTYVKDPKNSTISKKEIEKLKIIIAKKYPIEFVNLIKEEKNFKEFELERQFIEKTVLNTVDEYCKHTEKEQNDEDIHTAFYTTFKNLDSELSTVVIGRTKSTKSTLDNSRKEFRNSLENVIPSNLRKGITFVDLENKFNLDKISDDFYGITGYITDIKDTFHIDTATKSTKEGKEFINYRRQKKCNIGIYHNLINFFNEPYSFLDFTQEQYLQMEIELLSRLQNLTYQECSEEYNGPLFKPKDENDPRNFFFKTS